MVKKTKKEFVTCKCKRIQKAPGSTYIGKDCKCSMATKTGKIVKFESKEGIVTKLK